MACRIRLGQGKGRGSRVYPAGAGGLGDGIRHTASQPFPQKHPGIIGGGVAFDPIVGQLDSKVSPDVETVFPGQRAEIVVLRPRAPHGRVANPKPVRTGSGHLEGNKDVSVDEQKLGADELKAQKVPGGLGVAMQGAVIVQPTHCLPLLAANRSHHRLVGQKELAHRTG